MDEGASFARSRRHGGRWLLLITFVLLMTGVWGLWLALDRTKRHTGHTRTRLVAEQVAHRLEDFLRGRLLVLEFIRHERLENALADRAHYVALVTGLMREFGGFQAVNWIDAAGVIRWTCPRDKNQDAEGRSVFEHPVAAPVLAEAQRTRRPAMTPPLELFQGGRGFTLYVPVVDADNTLQGYVNGVFLIQSMVSEALSNGVLDAYQVLLSDGSEVLYGDPDSHRRAADARVVGSGTLNLLGHHWNLALVPSAALWESSLSGFGALVGLGGTILALALTFLLWLVMQRHEQRQSVLRERQRLQDLHHQSQKMEALGQLAGGVAHDFNNLMTAVLGNVELASEPGVLSATQTSALEEITLAAQRASALTAQLLAFSRRQVVPPHPLDLNHELTGLRSMLARLLRENVTLRLQLDPEAGAVLIDATQLSQVVMNLVVNAVDAMPEGGKLLISTKVDVDQEDVLLSVGDSGHGMDAATRRRAVEPFFTTKAIGRGTGLGLSTVYGIVTSAGGRLEIHSELGRGTHVDIWWPRVLSPMPIPQSEPTRTRDGTNVSGQGRVLVVEDNAAVRQVAVTLLRRAGFDVVEAEDGRAAIALASAQAFDVVVTDAIMPIMGGIELAQCLREQDADLRIVLCSGYAPPNDPAEVDRLGLVVLPKPYTADTLLRAVQPHSLSS